MRNIKFPITQQQLIGLQNKFHTDKKISKVLNISIVRVCQLRKKYGILVYPVKKDNLKRDLFIYNSFIEKKNSINELALQNNVSVMTIRRIIKFFKEKYDNKSS